MSSTNKTPNYDLPQYVADDKPTYLEDFNQTMMKIDTAIKETDVKAESVVSNVNNALETANQANETANQANETALHAQTDATNAIATSNNAKSDTDINTAKLNKMEEDINGWVKGTLTPNSQQAFTNASLSYKYNKKLGLLSVYGNFTTEGDSLTVNDAFLLPPSLTPKISRDVFNAGYFTTKESLSRPSNVKFMNDGHLKINTDRVKYAFITFLIAVNDWFE